MNRRTFGPLFALILSGLAVVDRATAAPRLFRVDPDHSAATFSIRHFTTKVWGRFRDLSGTLRYDREDPARSSVDIVLRADSIDTNSEERDAHLRSSDFFDAKRFPNLTFISVEVRETASGCLDVVGDLVIRGITQRIVVPVTITGIIRTPQGERLGFEATFAIDRKAYGISWNRVLEAGGTVLSDQVEITLSIEAVEREVEPAG